jgi:hypothetical membrane protein
VTRALLACGILGPTLFILTFLVDGATRPGYDPWRNLVSQLATGAGGWVQIANFVACGVLLIAMAIGLFRSFGLTATASIVAVLGVALILAGMFVTDPGFGYPPGTLERRTFHGEIHDYVSTVVFLSLGLAPLSAVAFASTSAWTGWRVYSALTGVIVLAFIVVTAIAVDNAQSGTWPNAPTGLLQRISIVAGLGWLVALSFRSLTRASGLGKFDREAAETAV